MKTTAKKTTSKKTASATFFNDVRDAVKQRLEKVRAKGLDNQARQLSPCVDVLTDALVQQAHEKLAQTDFSALCDSIAFFNDETGEGKEQVKTIIKIVDVLRTVTQEVTPRSNNFNVCIQAMVKNGNSANISELIVAQSSKAREGLAHKVRDTFSARSSGYTIGTGSSQASQVRQVLRVLGFAEAHKGKKDDSASLTAYGLNMLKPVYDRELTE